MFAPRPTNNGVLLVLLAILVASSAESFPTTTRTVYWPLTAAQVPRFTWAEVAPAAMAPLTEPVRVSTGAPAWLSSVKVMPCAAVLDATLPWLRMATRKVTAVPPDGLPGVHDGTGTRSALAISEITSDDGATVLLLPSLRSST